MGCSSCGKGGINKTAARVQQIQSSQAHQFSPMPALDIQTNNMNKYKKVFYIGKPGKVSGTMHKTYGEREYGEQLYVHVNDLDERFSENMPVVSTPVEQKDTELSQDDTEIILQVPNKKQRQKK